MGADYSFYVKSIAAYAPTFFGYIISFLASVFYDKMEKGWESKNTPWELISSFCVI